MSGSKNRLVRPRATRADYVVRKVRDYIFTNRLKPGDRIPSESELATALHVSRATLREAVKGLSLSGLLEAKPRTGTRVREFSYEQVSDALVAHFHLSSGVDLREILEARAALELSAVRLVVRRITPEEISELREIEARFEAATAESRTHVDLDCQLHAAFLKASGNRLLASMVDLLRAFFSHPSLEESILRRHYDREEQERTINEHRLLIEAVAARDLELASRVLHSHFDRQLQWLETEHAHENAVQADRGCAG